MKMMQLRHPQRAPSDAVAVTESRRAKREWTNEINSKWKKTQSRATRAINLMWWSEHISSLSHSLFRYSISPQRADASSIILFTLSFSCILMRNQRNNCWCGFSQFLYIQFDTTKLTFSFCYFETAERLTADRIVCQKSDRGGGRAE